MKNLINFLIKYHFGFLFLFLELLAFLMIVNFNDYHRYSFLNSSNVVTGSIFSMVDGVKEYGYLSKENKRLVNENARLKEMLLHFQSQSNILQDTLVMHSDSSIIYEMRNAKVINNSIDRSYNYMTLNKGVNDGLQVDQGVINDQGVVGVVTAVSDHYSVVISLLNKHFKLSSKIKKNSYFGSLSWDGSSFMHAKLNEIPFHVDIQEGDTIVTSGYSSIFPEGIPVGVISTFEKKGGSNFYNIDVRLSTDFKELGYVNIINYKTKEERLKLEDKE
ncbi:rod shape-determining protein MreC [Halosquirtibacter laminarini]|uniref:Rod shape-determining protein MreC n=1 Tax=Halosquirtibacter laminarini TaxID=3374600 RepID=A0AC61NFU8_9BACT|nr:rod shape-determining protein MreC [Prolixibacteraceae bacterium]